MMVIMGCKQKLPQHVGVSENRGAKPFGFSIQNDKFGMFVQSYYLEQSMLLQKHVHPCSPTPYHIILHGNKPANQ